MKSLQIGVRTNSSDWFQQCLKELNPCDPQKGLISKMGAAFEPMMMIRMMIRMAKPLQV